MIHSDDEALETQSSVKQQHSSETEKRSRRGPAGFSREVPKGILDRLVAVRPTLQPTGQSVADYILAHPASVVRMSVTELAEAVGVSETSIVRICQQIGARGFQDLKLAISHDLVDPIKSIYEDISIDDDTATVIEKVFYSDIQALTSTKKVLDYTALQQAVEIILAAEHIEWYGLGGSAFVAMYASHLLRSIGMYSTAVTDPFAQSMSGALANKNVCVIAISHSGSTRDIVEAVRLAKDAGAKVITVTRYGKTPLQEYTDVILHTLPSMTPFHAEISRISQFGIIDALFVCLILARPELALNCIERANISFADKRL